MKSVSEKLTKLRQLMADKNIDFYYVPTRDDHNNEYVPPHWQRRPWLTHFTGSYGEALVGLEKAYLWTDPRYTLQAGQELDLTEFQLMKQLQGVAAPVSVWLGENAFNCTVGVDPSVLSMAQRRQWSAVLSNAQDRKSTRLNSSHSSISYAVFCLEKCLPLKQIFVFIGNSASFLIYCFDFVGI